MIIRGDNFRVAFAQLGELRSSLPHLPLLAATATATKTTFDSIVSRMLMENPVVIGLSPCRYNIFLSVSTKSLTEFIDGVVGVIKTQMINTPKMVIFCRSYGDCNVVFDCLENKLGDYITYPPGYPVVRKYRLIDFYTRASTDKVKEDVLKEFVKEKSQIRLIVATSAFGMGIDSADIKQIYHWGSPHTIGSMLKKLAELEEINSQAMPY
jgi:bloom syndrome protein